MESSASPLSNISPTSLPLPYCLRTLLCQSHRGSERARSSSNASDVNLCAERLPIHFCRAGRPSKSLDSASPTPPAASRQFFFLHLIGSFLHLFTAFVTYPAHRRPNRSTFFTESDRSSQIGQPRDLRTNTLPLGTQWKSVNILKWMVSGLAISFSHSSSGPTQVARLYHHIPPSHHSPLTTSGTKLRPLLISPWNGPTFISTSRASMAFDRLAGTGQYMKTNWRRTDLGRRRQ